MQNIKIVQATTQEECDICDRFLEELMKFKTQFDNKILPFNGGKHHNLEKIKNGKIFLAYTLTNKKPAGYVMGFLKNPQNCGSNTNIVCLSTLFVKEEFRHSGIGTQLYNSFENWAKTKFGNDYAIEISAINGNENALAFYKSLGFVPIRTTLRKE